jgi:hypothetical protein
MIALASARRRRSSINQRRGDERFLKLLPGIRRQAGRAFRRLPLEQREEYIAEAVANAYCALARLAHRGQLHLAYLTPLADFAIRQVRAGRRVGTKRNVRDVSSRYCQRAKAVHVQRLDRYDRRRDQWREIVVEDRRAGPDHVVMVRLDFAAWLESLTSRNRRIAERLAAGAAGQDIARQFGISPGRVSQLRGELQLAWRRFQGEAVEAVPSTRP